METKQNVQYVRTLSILHLAMMIGQTLFIGAAAVLHKMGYITVSMKIGDKSLWAIPVFILILAYGGIQYRSSLRLIKAKSAFDQKLQAYLAAVIRQYAFVSATSFFSATIFLVTGSRWMIYFSAFNLVFFFMLRPTAVKVQKELELSSDEMDGLGQPI